MTPYDTILAIEPLQKVITAPAVYSVKLAYVYVLQH